MDSVLGKLRIYDFMGIWGPGAVTVTYYMFTLHEIIFDLFSKFPIANPGIPKPYLLIILYSAVAYAVGVILHEAGRLLAESIGIFRASNAIRQIKPNERAKDKHCWLYIFRNIQDEFQQKIIHIMPDEDLRPEFSQVVAELKYSNEIPADRIDHYHAIYAFARSTCLMFIGHAVLAIVGYCSNLDARYRNYVPLDLILAVLFFVRTYRYFYVWIENSYMQYHVNKQKKDASGMEGSVQNPESDHRKK